MIATRVLTGSALLDVLDEVAALRIAVFRDWPYLYDGDMAYERDYLQHYAADAGAVVVGAFDDDRLVGAATGMPLRAHADDFAAAFDGRGYDLDHVFYCAESVLLKAFRGQGVGHRFFDLREEHARSRGFKWSCFCAVVRPDDHPARPAQYRPLDAFWRARGYERLNGAVAEFAWRDLGEVSESRKPLQVWMRAL